MIFVRIKDTLNPDSAAQIFIKIRQSGPSSGAFEIKFASLDLAQSPGFCTGPTQPVADL